MAEDHRQNNVTLIFGKKGGGKSTFAWKLARPFPKRVYLDPMFQVQDAAIAYGLPAMVRYLAAMRHRPQFAVALRTIHTEEYLQAVALLLHGSPDKPMFPGTLLIADEMDRLCGPSSLPEPMDKLANYGRHYGVSLIGIARSPKKIHPDFRRNADEIYIGELHEPSDVDYLNEYVGSEFCSRARSVTDYEFIKWP
jgi:hypothetical protein